MNSKNRNIAIVLIIILIAMFFCCCCSSMIAMASFSNVPNPEQNQMDYYNYYE